MPYEFKPSSFYDAQCAVRVRLDYWFAPRSSVSSLVRNQLEERSATGDYEASNINKDNGNQFESRVVELLRISGRTCDQGCAGTGDDGDVVCRGMLAFKRAINEARKLSEGPHLEGSGQWHEAFAQLHIVPPETLTRQLGPCIKLSQGFADLVLVGTRAGKVVVEVVDMKYSPQAQPYHKQQVACYIHYLKAGPLATLLKDVEWQGSIWLPLHHHERASVSTAFIAAEKNTSVRAEFNFDTIEKGVLMQPISDLDVYLDDVADFFSQTLPRAVGSARPIDLVTSRRSHDQELAASLPDIEDLKWVFDEKLCRSCRHRSTCEQLQAAALYRNSRVSPDRALAQRGGGVYGFVSEKVMRCHAKDKTLSSGVPELVWDDFFTLTFRAGAPKGGEWVLKTPDLRTASTNELETWLRTVVSCVYVPSGPTGEPEMTCAFCLDQEDEQIAFHNFLEEKAQEPNQCLMLDSQARQQLQLILLLLKRPEDTRESTSPWRRWYWWEGPEITYLPSAAFTGAMSYEGDSCSLSQHVYVASEMIATFFDLPWSGAPITAKTVHALCSPRADTESGPSSIIVGAEDVCRDLFLVAQEILRLINNDRLIAEHGNVKWLPRPQMDSSVDCKNAKSLIKPISSAGEVMTMHAWKKFITMLVTFSGRRAVVNLKSEAIESALWLMPVVWEGRRVCKPLPGQDAAHVCAQLTKLITAAAKTDKIRTNYGKKSVRYKLLGVRFPTYERAAKFTAEEEDLQDYLSRLEEEEDDVFDTALPIQEDPATPMTVSQPLALVPNTEINDSGRCYTILLNFLASSMWGAQTSESSEGTNFVFGPYLSGTWKQHIVNPLACENLTCSPAGHEAHLAKAQRRAEAQCLADAQCRAVTNVYEKGSLTIIWGPPGTGKTKTLAHIVVDMFTATPTATLKVLIIANTNKALDVLSSKIDERVPLPFTKARTDEELKSRAMKTGKKLVVMCTVFKAYSIVWKQHKIRDFDVLIIDEASMLPASYAVLAGQLLKPKEHKVILAGDLLQLQPIQEDFASNAFLRLLYPTARHWMGSILQALFGDPHGGADRQLDELHRLYELCASDGGVGRLPAHVVQLNTCYRSRNNIVKLIACLYPISLECGLTGEKATGGVIQYVTVDSTGEAQAVIKVLSTCDTEKKTIVVTPHRRQRHMIRTAMAKSTADFGEVQVDTTECTQGTEAECVVLCYGPGVRVDTEFAYHLFRVNVAISRAISRVVLIVDAKKEHLLRTLPEGVTPFHSMVRDGRDVSPAMAGRGWQLLKEVLSRATEFSDDRARGGRGEVACDLRS